jgi:hypothetical protein
MSKKTMLLALAVVSFAMFALPTAASAQEIHWVTTSGNITLTAESEPTITCDSANVTLTPSAGGTTGSIHFDFTGCHTSVFGITSSCKTTESAAGTLTSKGTYHLITVGGKPAMLVTTEPVVEVCAGIASMTTQGNVIGTITSPACDVESNTMRVAFFATGSTQNDMEYTGVKYDLTATTGGGAAKTAGLTAITTIEQASFGRLECT